MTTPEAARRTHVAELILRLRRAGITDRRLVSAIEASPRDLFVPPEMNDDAYAERALPIDCGQTISAPVLVGQMTAALDVREGDRVLEIGTGTGYQTAILARLAKRVYTIERFRTLLAAAESRFRTLRLTNITTLAGDGIKGWPEQAPFDRIMVTASDAAVPEALLRQVRLGGVLIMPVGPAEGVQKLMRFERREEGVSGEELAEVRFVPLIPGKAQRL